MIKALALDFDERTALMQEKRTFLPFGQASKDQKKAGTTSLSFYFIEVLSCLKPDYLPPLPYRYLPRTTFADYGLVEKYKVAKFPSLVVLKADNTPIVYSGEMKYEPLLKFLKVPLSLLPSFPFPLPSAFPSSPFFCYPSNNTYLCILS